MEPIEYQRAGFDIIGVVFFRINQREKFGKPLCEIELKNSNQDQNSNKD